MDTVQENANVVDAKTQNQITATEEENGPDKEASRSSSVSSDDESSDEDFFQLDASQLSKPPPAGNSPASSPTLGLPSIEENAELIFEPSPHHGLASSPGGVPYHVDDDLMSSPDLADGSGTLGTGQSPPAQVMARSDVPDPNRIPSAIFSRTKSTSPMEWSVTSNESLFSIHMGNSSFSKDHIFLMGSPTDPSVPHSLSPLSPSNLDAHPGSPMQPDAAEEAAAANAQAMQEVMRATATGVADDPKPGTGKPVVLAASISKGSDGSNSSFRSFAFPILTKDARSGSFKVEPRAEKKQQQQQHQRPLSFQAESPKTPPLQTETPKEAPPKAAAAAGCKWFPCFSCCRFCW